MDLTLLQTVALVVLALAAWALLLVMVRQLGKAWRNE